MSAAQETGAQPYFTCRDLHAYYGESYIVQGVNLDVHDNEILALLGRNGAGKTSTLRTIARASQPALRKGEIYLRGQPVHSMKTHEAAQAGISIVPEDRRIIPGLTVEENLIVAQVAKSPGWTLDQIYEHFPRLAERRRQMATTLSGGEQQMLAIGRALARKVHLLLLDEPYEGLAPKIVQEIENILTMVKQTGMTTILVEQNAIAALRLADRCAILDEGHIVHTGKPDTVLHDEDIRRKYLAV
ncbi:amino acid/amide ABC transporter ATP-binding protein 2, HAAT family [Limimonas halophila]|uniref:Amino acid/amide ABC transporter ATP-binding protein 2, HAAT family n=1 Tax=Limimonas halophila TaxID=1082479 RepID=A0A1G7TDQ3_9PROT|nr:ABC transporter ATP-binding protein [Limimonas halophila]SDG32769.1 amino acid/amide ABC transporter ATP-binding protein 2, HAAT family [Limimonas halophila]